VQHDAQSAAVRRHQPRQSGDFLLLLLVVRLQHPVAADQVVLFEGQGDGDAQVVVVPRLEDELVDRAVVDRPHHRVGVGVAGEHDADGVGRLLLDLAQEARAVHAGHQEVADHQVEAAFGEALQAFLAAAGADHLVVFLAEDADQRAQDARLVVDQEQPVTGGRQMRGRGLGDRLLAGEQVAVVSHPGSGS